MNCRCSLVWADCDSMRCASSHTTWFTWSIAHCKNSKNYVARELHFRDALCFLLPKYFVSEQLCTNWKGWRWWSCWFSGQSAQKSLKPTRQPTCNAADKVSSPLIEEKSWFNWNKNVFHGFTNSKKNWWRGACANVMRAARIATKECYKGMQIKWPGKGIHRARACQIFQTCATLRVKSHSF